MSKYRMVLKDTDYDSVKLAMTTADENILEKLSKDSDSSVRYEVAMNKNCPEKILIRLAEDTNKDVIRAVAQNENTPVEVLEKLLNQELQNPSNYWLTYDILENPSFKKSELSKDIRYMNTVEAQNLAESSTDSKVLRELSEHIRSKEINPCLASNKNTPQDILTKLAESRYRLIRKLVAENPNTPLEVLKKLAKDIDTNVKAGVARNPSSTKDILEKLSNDRANSVKNTAKNNLSEKYRLVLKDEEIDLSKMNWKKKLELANNTKDEDILKELAKEEHYWIREEIPSNPNCPEELLRKLAKDESELVRKAVASSKNTPVDVLRQLAEDKDGIARYGVAENPNCPLDILRKLSEDEKDYVYKKASERLLKKKAVESNTPKNKLSLSDFKLSLGEPDGAAPSGYGATFTAEMPIVISTPDGEGEVTVYGDCEDYQQWDDWIETYCKATGKDESEVLENKCNSETKWDLSEDSISERLDEFLEDNDLEISEAIKSKLVQKIIALAKKGIKKYWSWDPELVEDMNYIGEDDNSIKDSKFRDKPRANLNESPSIKNSRHISLAISYDKQNDFISYLKELDQVIEDLKYDLGIVQHSPIRQELKKTYSRMFNHISNKRNRRTLEQTFINLYNSI